jgi:hypothetical protein
MDDHGKHDPEACDVCYQRQLDKDFGSADYTFTHDDGSPSPFDHKTMPCPVCPRNAVRDLLLEAELFADTNGNRDLRDRLRAYRWDVCKVWVVSSLLNNHPPADPSKDLSDDGQQDDKHEEPPAPPFYALPWFRDWLAGLVFGLVFALTVAWLLFGKAY